MSNYLIWTRLVPIQECIKKKKKTTHELYTTSSKFTFLLLCLASSPPPPPPPQPLSFCSHFWFSWHHITGTHFCLFKSSADIPAFHLNLPPLFCFLPLCHSHLLGPGMWLQLCIPMKTEQKQWQPEQGPSALIVLILFKKRRLRKKVSGSFLSLFHKLIPTSYVWGGSWVIVYPLCSPSHQPNNPEKFLL